MEDDHKFLIEFYQKIENYEHLIIDVRWNEGGSYLPWMKNVIVPLAKTPLKSKMYLAYRSGKYVTLFREMANIQSVIPKETFQELPPEVLTDDFTVYDYTHTVEPSKDVAGVQSATVNFGTEQVQINIEPALKFDGKIIILIDKLTFSATDAFALFCKETSFGTLYGLPTGGDGISESPVFYVLPNSKLVIRFTPAMGIDYTGQANEEVRVQPDVYYESQFGDHDELIEYVLEHLTSEATNLEK